MQYNARSELPITRFLRITPLLFPTWRIIVLNNSIIPLAANNAGVCRAWELTPLPADAENLR